MSEFEKAAKYVQNMPKGGPVQPTTEQRLELYKYFKQAKEGDNTTPHPGMLALEAKSKWNAWDSVKGTSKEEAEKRYVAALDKIVLTWRQDSEKMGL